MDASVSGRGGDADESRGEVREELSDASCGDMMIGDSGM